MAQTSTSSVASSRSSLHAARAARLLHRSSGVMSKFLEKQVVREFLAEFIGTFILIAVGDGALASYVLKSKDPSRVDGMAVCLCWGVGAMIGITASASISGGHINPAVTVSLAVLGKFSWKKVWHYLTAQYMGAFLAAAVVYLSYYDALLAFDGGNRVALGADTASGQIFATYPAEYLSIAGSFVDQAVGTGILMFAVLAVGDQKGLKIPSWLQPVYMMFVITVMCIAYGLNCMAILNPARDLGPRLFTTIAGWGWASFQPLGGHYWWVAGILGPHFGAVAGGWVYLLTTTDHSARRLEAAEAAEAADQSEKTELRAVAAEGLEKEEAAAKEMA